jgi:hypothetical protein
VYWTSDGRLSVDAVFVAAGVTFLLLIGVGPKIVPSPANQHGDTWEAITSLSISVLVTFTLAAITLLKGKIWTGLFGLFLFPLLIVGAIRLARPGSPWARWRYQRRPHKRARAARRERQVRQPVIRFKSRVEDFLSGLHDRPDHPQDSAPDKRKAVGHSDAKQRDRLRLRDLGREVAVVAGQVGLDHDHGPPGVQRPRHGRDRPGLDAAQEHRAGADGGGPRARRQVQVRADPAQAVRQGHQCAAVQDAPGRAPLR